MEYPTCSVDDGPSSASGSGSVINFPWATGSDVNLHIWAAFAALAIAVPVQAWRLRQKASSQSRTGAKVPPSPRSPNRPKHARTKSFDRKGKGKDMSAIMLSRIDEEGSVSPPPAAAGASIDQREKDASTSKPRDVENAGIISESEGSLAIPRSGDTDRDGDGDGDKADGESTKSKRSRDRRKRGPNPLKDKSTRGRQRIANWAGKEEDKSHNAVTTLGLDMTPPSAFSETFDDTTPKPAEAGRRKKKRETSVASTSRTESSSIGASVAMTTQSDLHLSSTSTSNDPYPDHVSSTSNFTSASGSSGSGSALETPASSYPQSVEVQVRTGSRSVSPPQLQLSMEPIVQLVSTDVGGGVGQDQTASLEKHHRHPHQLPLGDIGSPTLSNLNGNHKYRRSPVPGYNPPPRHRTPSQSHSHSASESSSMSIPPHPNSVSFSASASVSRDPSPLPGPHPHLLVHASLPPTPSSARGSTPEVLYDSTHGQLPKNELALNTQISSLRGALSASLSREDSLKAHCAILQAELQDARWRLTMWAQWHQNHTAQMNMNMNMMWAAPYMPPQGQGQFQRERGRGEREREEEEEKEVLRLEQSPVAEAILKRPGSLSRVGSLKRDGGGGVVRPRSSLGNESASASMILSAREANGDEEDVTTYEEPEAEVDGVVHKEGEQLNGDIDTGMEDHAGTMNNSAEVDELVFPSISNC